MAFVCPLLHDHDDTIYILQTKKDLRSAEEYYCRAILADPTDGDVLCQYAKLVWELHRDRGRARNYFERAVQAAGEDRSAPNFTSQCGHPLIQ